MTIIDQETFFKLPTDEVAKLVRAAGPQVCVFPINGTRRWFMLEHASDVKDGSIENYLDIGGKQYIQVYKMCFEHGLDTLLTPDFGSELLLRGDEYIQKIGAEGLTRMATHPDFLSFYQKYKVRVHFYGDYRKQLAGTPFSYLCDLFDDVTKQTARNNSYRLFHGVFANDATETIAELSVQHFQKTGSVPSRRELVEQYYGEYVDAASLFIGFEKFSVFDYPILGLGQENLYFTVAPSLYFDTPQLRSILYDHVYLRRVQELDYAQMSEQAIISMRSFYQENRETTLGVGELRDGTWYPVLQAKNNLIGAL
jgi:tuberculosinol/isotuberculosinol synthase